MTIILELGGVIINLKSERELPVSSIMIPFIHEKSAVTDLCIQVTWEWENARHPVTMPVGEDLLQQYYKEGRWIYCESKGGKAPVTCTCYNEDFSQIQCAVNEKPFLEPPKTLERIIQLLPMRAIFVHFKTLFLHSAQVTLNGKGILFSAPSGTGKTTQAKLWKKYMGAEIVCSDRTLIHRNNGYWRTYGYPMDGSEPVCSGAVNRLGCIVFLKQGKENQVEKLRPAKAASLLMTQAVIDCWDAKAQQDTMELLLEILKDIPVYQLICTPDRRAVSLLADKLEKEGVI